MIISQNLMATNSHRVLTKNQTKMSKTLERMSTGLRISKSADDAAGLAISEKMRAQIKGLQKAAQNAQDGISLIQTADGALNEMNSVLGRMRELSIKASNDTLTEIDRTEVSKEFEQLKDNLSEIAEETEFNGKRLFNGDAGALASTSNSKIKAYAIGSLEDIEGDYKILTDVKAGKGQVQQSAIMMLKNGTVSEGVEYSAASNKNTGIEGFSAKNILPEDYRINTREKVYGGISYNGTSGIDTVDTTGAPNIVANGSYDIVTADEVPFMATYDNSQTGVDIVEGVSATGRSDIDVKMDITENGGAINAQSEIAWKDIGGVGGGDIQNAATGGDVAFQTKANNPYNVYTHFNVQSTDSRDTLTNNVTAST
ncbi:MAG TPA: flagellin, partial [Thermotogota bacterium]|nr:flagellin [Thermotogota bacterium]